MRQQERRENNIARSFNNLNSSPNIIWVIKLRSMRWAGHVAHKEEVRTGFWWGNLWKRDHLEDSGIDDRMLRWIFTKWGEWGGGAKTGLIWLRIGTGGRYLKMQL